MTSQTQTPKRSEVTTTPATQEDRKRALDGDTRDEARWLGISIMRQPSSMADRRRRRHRDDGTALSGRPPDAQRLQYEERQERTDPVKRDGRDEDGHPAARDSLQDVSEGHEQRCRALRRVEEAVVGGRKLAAKEVAARRGEQAVDLSPGEEHQTREHDEQRRDVGKGDEKQDP